MAENVTGLLYSQIGYEPGWPMRAIVRGPAGTLSDAATFTVAHAETGTPVLESAVTHWGALWGSDWWVADFSSLERSGSFRLTVRDVDRERFASESFEVVPGLLWERTWRLVGLDQNERRRRLAREKLGWYDAGTAWQEANSHAGLVVGLCDVLEFAPGRVTEDDRRRVEEQIVNGCDYLTALQDRAAQLPGGEGAVVHQIWKYDELILPADVSKAALAWALAARHLAKTAYLDRAERALRWLKTASPFGGKGFNRINNGYPDGAPVPDEWMTRDLLMQVWAAFEVAQAGRDEWRDEAAELARTVMARQVPRERGEDGLFGYFRTFDGSDVSEKAWTHNGDGGYGADCGGQFPHWVLPLLRMRQSWPDHPDAARWEQCLRDFAYGYLLPACAANPFHLLPLGHFAGQGLLWFAGLWHGMNAAYALTAALAREFELFFGDAAFRQVTAGNLQWIAGLNAGLTADSLFASHMYSRDVPAGVALPVGMICGIGRDWAGPWMNIRGAICNGFSVGDQFRFDLPATKENDGPHAFTDEDWITHAGGWLSALSRL